MNTTKGYRGESCESIATKPATPINRVEAALNEAVELAQETISMVAALVGSAPSDRSGGGSSGADGIIPSLADRADDSVVVIRDAKAQLRRLASLLEL